MEARVCDFVRMNPPKFSRSEVGKDPRSSLTRSRKYLVLCQYLVVIGDIDILPTQGCDSHMVHSYNGHDFSFVT